jgi:hypothetical protein
MLCCRAQHLIDTLMSYRLMPQQRCAISVLLSVLSSFVSTGRCIEHATRRLVFALLPCTMAAGMYHDGCWHVPWLLACTMAAGMY